MAQGKDGARCHAVPALQRGRARPNPRDGALELATPPVGLTPHRPPRKTLEWMGYVVSQTPGLRRAAQDPRGITLRAIAAKLIS